MSEELKNFTALVLAGLTCTIVGWLAGAASKKEAENDAYNRGRLTGTVECFKVVMDAKKNPEEEKTDESKENEEA